MAQEIKVILTDDMTGGKAAETINFVYDGTAYEIDLNAKNAAKFRKMLAEYTGAGRPIKNGQARKPGRKPTAGRTKAQRGERAGIREWARARGLSVSERGRIPRAVIEQYDAAH